MSIFDPKHLLRALAWSFQGIAYAVKTQVSFRMDLAGVAGVFLVLCLIRPGLPWSGVLLAGALLVPLVELLNSAVEEVCDLITRERNERIKRAKDMGSAAVFLAVILNAVLWAAMLWDRFST